MSTKQNLNYQIKERLLASQSLNLKVNGAESDGPRNRSVIKEQTTFYKVESGFGWFIVETTNARKAKSEGIKEWGRGTDITVTKATDEDITYYRNLKGNDATRATVY